MKMDRTELHDEVDAINAIYGEGTAVLDDRSRRGPNRVMVKIPQSLVVLRLAFPQRYPAAAPSAQCVQSSGTGAVRGHGEETLGAAKEILANLPPGQVCLFELISALENAPCTTKEAKKASPAPVSSLDRSTSSIAYQTSPLSQTDQIPWVLSQRVGKLGTTWLARAIRVDNVEQAKAYIAHYIETDKGASKAKHNMTAWRIKGTKASMDIEDYDDDGEKNGGRNLLAALQTLDMWNALIIVTRWYGGVHLGPSRFHYIFECSAQALKELEGIEKPVTMKKKR